MAAKAGDDGVNPNCEIKVCKECKMSFSDIFAYAEHLESKQHIKRVMKNKYAVKYLATKDKLDAKKSEEKNEISFNMLSALQKKVQKCEKELSEVDENPDATIKDESDDDDVYHCEVCEKICTGLITYQLHLEGRKHKKNMKKQALLKHMKEQNLIPVLNDKPKEDNLFESLFPGSRLISPVMDCKTCKKTCLGPEAYRQHCKSASHQKKIALEELLKSKEAEDLSPVKAQVEDNAPFAHCVTCGKTFSGPMPQMQHLRSPAHLKQVRRLEQLGLIQNLVVSKEEESKIRCKVCGKMFSGPVPFNAHIESSAHGKIQKKMDLTEKLTKEHPEFVKSKPIENSDDDEDQLIVLACTVCEVVFSGPEAAHDHFSSTNHKKAKKQKEMFKKFKQQQKAAKLRATSDDSKAKKSQSDDSSDFDDEFDIIQA